MFELVRALPHQPRTAAAEKKSRKYNYSPCFSCVRSQGMVELVRTNLAPLQRMVLAAKLVIDVHARDTVEQMCQMGITWSNDFEWQRQLRYYWDEEEDDCLIRQTNTRFKCDC